MPISRDKLLAKPPPRDSADADLTAPTIDREFAVNRIRMLAIAVIGLWVFERLLGVLLFALAPEVFADRHSFGLPNLFWAVLPSLAIFLIFRFKRIPLPMRFGIGIAYVMLVCVLIAAGEVSKPWWTDGGRLPGLPWVSVWLLLVPLVVPIRAPRGAGRAIVLSIIPPGVLFAGVTWFGLPAAPITAYPDYFVPCLITSVLGAFIARMIHRLTRQVREAQRLGSYHLEEQIGSGGMGEVWRARHNMLVRPAAIKLIRPEKLTAGVGEEQSSLVDRFQLEAQATATLRSPHTVELYDFGMAEDGTFFYVMELLDGFDLEKLVQRVGPLQPNRVVFLMKQICESLADAHANGLIHRDIKPANIYVCRVGQRSDFVKILDFGLVRWTQLSRDSLALTADQTMLGTPAFMAPELVSGEPGDHRLDLYSLGCVGYWLLTGGFVFPADTPLAMAVAHAKQEPVPPSKHSELQIPSDLDRIIMDCLAKNPADRPPSAADLAARLDECDCGEAWSDKFARSWWDTHLPVKSFDT
jgi:hypothetical protein